MTSYDIAVLGLGRMGRGIAEAYAFGGKRVLMVDAKDRDEAAGNLRGAALHFLPGDLDVQTDALRLTLMSAVIPWEHV
ncbi:MAG: 3-hydroxyacyl-CoA dehydrogenase NAD-binding domain-containing protein, partial [Sphingomonadales bacterium]